MTISSLALVDSTLREGEQFALAHFTTAQKLHIAEMLDDFGIDYVEMTSPISSPQAEADLRAVAATSRRFRLLAHTRCRLDDVRHAVDAGVDGVNVLLGTSPLLQRHSHGQSIDQIVESAVEVVTWLQERGIEVRFSCEDAFRSNLDDILRIYSALDGLGIDRIGIADTVGIATPNDVTETVTAVRAAVGCDIEFHGHNDTDCAVANALAALEAGATHIDVTILGIGERNGIAPLAGMVARMATVGPQLLERYRTDLLPRLDNEVAAMVGVAVPFNAAITAPTAFSHKAGIHTASVLRNPATYEVLDPARFGRRREVLLGHRLTGRHSLRQRASELGLVLTDIQLHEVAAEVRTRAGRRPLRSDEVDALIQQTALGFLVPVNAMVAHAGGHV